MEVWKDVVGYEGKYQVSNLGRVKSLPKKMGRGIGYMTEEKYLNRPQTIMATTYFACV